MLEKFADFVRSQGGDAREVYEPSLLPQAPVRLEVPAPSSCLLYTSRCV